MIFYPRKMGLGSPVASTARSNNNYNDARLPRFHEVKPHEDIVIPYRREEPMRGVSIEDNRVRSNSVPAPSSSRLNRALSNQSQRANMVPLINLPAPAAKAPDAGAGTKVHDRSSSRANNLLTVNTSKPEVVSGTLYYQDALAKTQQHPDHVNDFYDDEFISSPQMLPERSMSPNSSYSGSGHQRTGSHGSSIHPLVPKPSKNPNRAVNNSVDYHHRPSQGTANMSNQPGLQRPYQQQQPATNERSSADSDREMIQVAYKRNIAEEETAYNDSKFYEDLGRAHVNTNAPGPRPFSPLSPRHF